MTTSVEDQYADDPNAPGVNSLQAQGSCEPDPFERVMSELVVAIGRVERLQPVDRDQHKRLQDQAARLIGAAHTARFQTLES